MITDIGAYLKYFDGIRRRTERDVAALPPEAVDWRPPPLAGESEWSIGQIVSHIGSSRLYFASAYRGEGWIGIPATYEQGDRETWLAWLRESGDRFVDLLKTTPNEWLARRVEMIDTPGSTLSGWRVLMMMIEHEVHHRSQIDSYAGLQGWPVPDIFGRSAEAVASQDTNQRAKYRL